MVQVGMMTGYVFLLFGVVEEDNDGAGGDGRGREQVMISPEGLLYKQFVSGNPRIPETRMKT